MKTWQRITVFDHPDKRMRRVYRGLDRKVIDAETITWHDNMNLIAAYQHARGSQTRIVKNPENEREWALEREM